MNINFPSIILLMSTIYCTCAYKKDMTREQEEIWEKQLLRKWTTPDILEIFDLYEKYDKSNDTGEGPYDLSKIRNVVAYNVTEKENENMTQTAVEIGLKIGMEEPLRGIDRAYRLKCSEPVRPVIIKLRNTMLKEKWMNYYLKTKLYKEGFRLKPDEVHKRIRKLAEKTKKWGKDKSYAVWTILSDVYYKKTNDSPVYKVKDLAHLHQIVDNEFKFEVTDKIQTQFYRNASISYVPTFFNYTGPTPRTGPRPRRRG